nr:MAG TPA: Middle operon regulator, TRANSCRIPTION.2A [Caudoviricetes sp.]
MTEVPNGPKTKKRTSRKKPGRKPVKQKARVELDEVIEFDYKGIKLSKQERNERMKLEFIRGMDVAEIAHRYGVSKTTVEILRSKGKWVKLKKQFDDEKSLVTNDTLTQMYAGFKVSVNIKYHAAWEKLMNIIEMALDNPDKYLMTDKGQIRWGALDVLSNIIDRAQAGQERANGMIPAEVQYRLQIEREKITLLRKKMGDGDTEEEVRDNFVEALDNAAKAVWKDFANETGAYIKEVSNQEANND